MKGMNWSQRNKPVSIRDVWADNLEEAFDVIQEAILDFPYIAVDTEYPGVLVRPILSYRDKFQYRYFTTKANVDMLKLIQVGITLMDEKGKTPEGISTWCFNFSFDLEKDMSSPDSIDLLKK